MHQPLENYCPGPDENRWLSPSMGISDQEGHQKPGAHKCWHICSITDSAEEKFGYLAMPGPLCNNSLAKSSRVVRGAKHFLSYLPSAPAKANVTWIGLVISGANVEYMC